MKFVPAKFYTSVGYRQVDLVVIHDMEAPEKSTTAEAVASWFARGGARASAHYNCDSDSTVQSVRDSDVAWHAPGANHNGIGIELAGYARQTAEEWRDEYSSKMLKEQVAPLVRSLCKKYKVPMRFVDRNGLRRGERGITTHHEVSRAFGRSSHWDPGPNFPMSWLLELVKGSDSGPSTKSVPVVATEAKLPILKVGSRGGDVKQWQSILVGAGHKLKADGIFGPKTKEATIAFQKVLGVSSDGVVGPQTRDATARLLAYVKAAGSTTTKPASEPKGGDRPLLKRGSKGSAVRELQLRLNSHGMGLKADGIFGYQTYVAVRRFQRAHGLSADGIAGPKTWAALG